jgi:hypothetical membrane protein
MSQAVETEGKIERSRRFTGRLGFSGVVGPVVFLLGSIVAGVLREKYSLIHQVISDLGVGENAWAVNGALIGTGLLLSVFNIAFFRSMRGTLKDSLRWLCTFLLELSPVGFVVAGVFTEAPATRAIHWMVGAILAFYGPLAAFLVVGLSLRRLPEWRGWARFSFVIWGVTLVSVLVMMWGFVPGASFGQLRLGGLLERLVFIAVLSWYFVFGSHIWQLRR